MMVKQCGIDREVGDGWMDGGQRKWRCSLGRKNLGL